MPEGFAHGYDFIATMLINKIEIEIDGKKEKITALWDTGCTKSTISKKLVEKLNLISIGDGFLDTISDERVPSKIYKVKLILPNNIEFPNIEVIDGEPKNCDILIGMDIITTGDFAVLNYNGKTEFVFRRPSMGKFTYEPVKSGNLSRNDPCPCGSGKKYKHCCLIKNNKY